MKRYIFKKYGNSYFKYFLRLNQNADGTRKKSIGITGELNGRTYTLNIPRLYDLNSVALWAEIIPTLDLLNYSFLTNPEPYVKRAIKIAMLRKDLKSKLFLNQKELCPICNKHLIDWNDFLNINNFDKFMETFNQINPSLSEIGINDYYKHFKSSNFNSNQNEEGKINLEYQFNFEKADINKAVTSKSISLLANRVTDWSKDLKIDHYIPLKLAGKIKELKDILDGITNLRLVHKDCHKNKTFYNEEMQLFKDFRKTRKALLNKDINIRNLSLEKINNLQIANIVKLEEQGELQYLQEKMFKSKNFNDLQEIYEKGKSLK
jgi:hypothetical protein